MFIVMIKKNHHKKVWTQYFTVWYGRKWS